MKIPVYSPPCVHRMVFRSLIKPSLYTDLFVKPSKIEATARKLVENGQLITISLFSWKQTLFLYAESTNDRQLPIEFEKVTSTSLLSCPHQRNGSKWTPMMDIFHYGYPQSVDHWKRLEKPQEFVGRVVFLRPEMVSSYIFYHFQLQEERPTISNNKYGLICLHENLLFFYMEKPNVNEDITYPGHLTTNNTPPNWSEVMEPHFLPWPDRDEERLWRPIECIWGI